MRKLKRTKKKVNNNVEVLSFLKNTVNSNQMWIWTWKTTLKLWKIQPKIHLKNHIKNTYIYRVY